MTETEVTDLGVYRQERLKPARRKLIVQDAIDRTSLIAMTAVHALMEARNPEDIYQILKSYQASLSELVVEYGAHR